MKYDDLIFEHPENGCVYCGIINTFSCYVGLWYDPVRARTYDLPHERRTR